MQNLKQIRILDPECRSLTVKWKSLISRSPSCHFELFLAKLRARPWPKVTLCCPYAAIMMHSGGKHLSLMKEEREGSLVGCFSTRSVPQTGKISRSQVQHHSKKLAATGAALWTSSWETGGIGGFPVVGYWSDPRTYCSKYIQRFMPPPLFGANSYDQDWHQALASEEVVGGHSVWSTLGQPTVSAQTGASPSEMLALFSLQKLGWYNHLVPRGYWNLCTGFFTTQL